MIFIFEKKVYILGTLFLFFKQIYSCFFAKKFGCSLLFFGLSFSFLFFLFFLSQLAFSFCVLKIRFFGCAVCSRLWPKISDVVIIIIIRFTF